MDLSGNFVRHDGAKILRAHAEASFPHITSLSVANNDLQAAGILELSCCASLCQSLKSLVLGENGLDTSTAAPLERLVHATTSLTSLDIDHADLTCGYHSFFTALAELRNLKSLRLLHLMVFWHSRIVICFNMRLITLHMREI
jgi:hypothetical protein